MAQLDGAGDPRSRGARGSARGDAQPAPRPRVPRTRRGRRRAGGRPRSQGRPVRHPGLDRRPREPRARIRHRDGGLQPRVQLLRRAADARAGGPAARRGHRLRDGGARRARLPRGDAAGPDGERLPRWGRRLSPACSIASTRSRDCGACASRPRTPSTSTSRWSARSAICERLCPYLHLPFQSGSDRILASMRRGYTREEYLAIVDRLRDSAPGLALSTDVIVGYPGETEAEFEADVGGARARRLRRGVRLHVLAAAGHDGVSPGGRRGRGREEPAIPGAQRSAAAAAAATKRGPGRPDARGPRRVDRRPWSGLGTHAALPDRAHRRFRASWSGASSRSEITGAGPNALQGRLSQNVH